MRIIQVHCNRCGQTCLGGHSMLRVEAGNLANQIEGDPFIDLCSDRWAAIPGLAEIRPAERPS